MSSDVLLGQARRALIEGDYEKTIQLCEQVLARQAKEPEALLTAGEAATKIGNLEQALAYYAAVPKTDTEDYRNAVFSAGEVARGLGRVDQAVEYYRQLLKLDPHHLPCHERLGFLLDLQGRRYEARPYLFEQLQQDHISYSVLIRLGSRDALIDLPDEIAKIRRAQPQSATVDLIDAIQAINRENVTQAEEALRRAIAKRPTLWEAHARLGRLLADSDMAHLPAWEESLPPGAEAHPDVWATRALWAQKNGQKQAAVRAFWEAAERDPDHRLAHYQLGQLLNETGFSEQAKGFASRASHLQQLAVLMTKLSGDSHDLEAMKSAVDVLEKLGRFWEAYGWCGLILVNDLNQPTIRERMRSFHAMLSPELPLTDPTFAPAGQLDLSHLPVPHWTDSTPAGKSSPPPLADKSPIRFADQARESGLVFTYENGHEKDAAGMRMFGFSGGGIGVLDYDQDGFPDVYLTQGCSWPPETESVDDRDQLFRNLGNGQFENVTEQVGLGDGRFSQGVSAGDFNNDGWPDLYLANIGQNRLYENQGDGTFLDVTKAARLTASIRTTSCLVADLNGDRHPDLYDVNYVGGEDVFDRLCPANGRLRACAPGVFPAERDGIFLSDGQGSFRAWQGSESAALDPPRPGLGIIAADWDGSGRLSLFIANDAVANTLLLNETPPSSHRLTFREEALLRGLAFDRNGRAQACMGVAADDVDGNGRFDLFVTNYYEEANAMYLQSQSGTFVESSRETGLYEPSYKQLGFGAQFLDADLDGQSDLVVTNGHLDDFQFQGIPYRMPPQFFANRGEGQFQVLPADVAGRYFQRKLIGRSLALLDWNRDGRPDFLVLHLYDPAALLTNFTQPVGHWLKIRLVGVNSPRDALGSQVTVEARGTTWTRQLMGGNGYQVSNERVLLFGLNDCDHVDRVSIRWPSGDRQEWKSLEVDQEILLIEGSSRYHPIPAN